MSDKSESITIEFPLDKLVKGNNAYGQCGHYVHRQDHEGGWCMRYGDTPRTRSNEFENRVLKHADQKHPTHLQITEDEIEKNIIIARREARNSVARLQNLEKLQLELCLMRQNRIEPEHFSDDEHYLTVSSCDEVIGEGELSESR